jgi:hypothetical protein
MLLVGHVFIIISRAKLLPKSTPSKEEILEIRFITSLLTIIIKVSKVLLIKEDPKAALNRELG